MPIFLMNCIMGPKSCLYTSYFGKCSTPSGNFWHINYIHTMTNKHTTVHIQFASHMVSMSIQT
jgi:hypothetical protein